MDDLWFWLLVAEQGDTRVWRVLALAVPCLGRYSLQPRVQRRLRDKAARPVLQGGPPVECGILPNGSFHGPYRSFHSYPYWPSAECTYNAGKLEGPCRAYFTNGMVSSECAYADGKKEGRCREWYVPLHIHASRALDPDYASISKWHEEHDLASESHYAAGVLHGPHRKCSPSGRLEEEGAYANGMKEGEWTFCRAGGAREVRTYAAGIATGPYLEYYSNGRLKEKGESANGVLNGPFASFYSNGVQREECTYAGGKREGPCRKWRRNGNPWKFCAYEADVLEGRYTLWSNNRSRVKKECVYRRGRPEAEK